MIAGIPSLISACFKKVVGEAPSAEPDSNEPTSRSANLLMHLDYAVNHAARKPVDHTNKERDIRQMSARSTITRVHGAHKPRELVHVNGKGNEAPFVCRTSRRSVRCDTDLRNDRSVKRTVSASSKKASGKSKIKISSDRVGMGVRPGSGAASHYAQDEKRFSASQQASLRSLNVNQDPNREALPQEGCFSASFEKLIDDDTSLAPSQDSELPAKGSSQEDVDNYLVRCYKENRNDIRAISDELKIPEEEIETRFATIVASSFDTRLSRGKSKKPVTQDAVLPDQYKAKDPTMKWKLDKVLASRLACEFSIPKSKINSSLKEGRLAVRKRNIYTSLENKFNRLRRNSLPELQEQFKPFTGTPEFPSLASYRYHQKLSEKAREIENKPVDPVCSIDCSEPSGVGGESVPLLTHVANEKLLKVLEVYDSPQSKLRNELEGCINQADRDEILEFSRDFTSDDD